MSQVLLTQKYRPLGRMSSGELLLQHSDALNFVDDCEQLGLVILGLEFFVEQGAKIVPLDIADYSNVLGMPDAVHQTVSSTRELIGGGFPSNAQWVTFIVS